MEIRKIKISNKKAAIEISMTTIITIILSVVFLILALTILRRMYGFQTEAIGSVQDKTLAEINKLYLGEEDTGTRIFIQLGSEKMASIRAGTDNFGIEIGAGTKTGAAIQNASQLQFKLWLDETSPDNCVKILGKSATTSLFKTRLDTWLPAERFSDSAGGLIVYVNVPAGTRMCAQKVFVQAKDSTVNLDGEILGQDFFTVEILRKNPMGF
jgi:hypothetical protein